MSAAELIIAALALPGAIIGFLHGVRQLDRDFIWLLLGSFGGALLCYLIGEGKSGSGFAGIVGIVSAVVLACVGGGLILGGAAGLMLRQAQERAPRPISRRQQLIGRWLIFGLSAIAVVLSITENSGSGGHF